MSDYQPPAQTVFAWLHSNLGSEKLAPLTGTDSKALAAAAQLLELYAYHREPMLLEAFGIIVRCMQPQTRQLAFHAIAHVMDWSDRCKIWDAADLPRPWVNPWLCSFEPGGSRIDLNPEEIPV